MQENDFKISAILPNYNSSLYLSQAIESLANQTEAFFEIIIIEDGSTDNSCSIIEKYLNLYSNINLIKHSSNQGVCEALNHGLHAAKGDYIFLAAADDWYQKDIVSQAKKVLGQHNSVGVICGDAMVYRHKSRPFYRRLPFVKRSFISSQQFKLHIRKNYTFFNGGGGMFINRNAIVEAGFLSSKLRWHCDWMLYFVIALRYGIYYTGTLFVNIQMRKGGYSEGVRHYPIQKNVMLDTIDVIRHQYPDLWYDFKRSAILPHYSIRYLPLFLRNHMMKKFLTFKLLWRLFINNFLIVRIGKLFPHKIILWVKQSIRA